LLHFLRAGARRQAARGLFIQSACQPTDRKDIIMQPHFRQSSLGLLLLAALAGSAHAETPTVANERFVATRTRAEVQAELADFKKSGVNPWSASYNPLRQFRSATTREAIAAAFIASRDEVKALHGEDSGSAFLARARTPQADTQWLAGTPRAAQ
jgi:hypothetical protein